MKFKANFSSVQGRTVLWMDLSLKDRAKPAFVIEIRNDVNNNSGHGVGSHTNWAESWPCQLTKWLWAIAFVSSSSKWTLITPTL